MVSISLGTPSIHVGKVAQTHERSLIFSVNVLTSLKPRSVGPALLLPWLVPPSSISPLRERSLAIAFPPFFFPLRVDALRFLLGEVSMIQSSR